MAKVRFTNKAVEDLSTIWRYTAKTWSERQADSYYEMLVDSCGNIAKDPFLHGKKYEQVAEYIYGCRANRHLIFYRILSDTQIEVIRILHGSMDLRNRLLD